MNSEKRDDPVVSIIMPCFNREHLIKRAIDSSLSQTIRNVEVIVINDCSTDGTSATVNSFGSQVSQIRLKKNVGPSTARNLGLNEAKGEFVLFLDSDDYIEPNSLENLTTSSRFADITFGPFALEKRGEIYKRLMPIETDCPLEFSYNWVCGQFVPPCSVLWRRSFVQAMGGWRDTALRNTDGEIVLRAMIMGAQFSFAKEGLGIYCQHESPGRVSRRSGRIVLHNEIETFESLLDLAKSQNFDGIERVIGRSMYRLAIEAFSLTADDIGEIALARARDLGFRGHIGDWRHRVSARVLGTKRKFQLARRLRNVGIMPYTGNRNHTAH